MPVIVESFRRVDGVVPRRSEVASVFFTVHERRESPGGGFIVVPTRVQYDLVNGELTTADMVPGPALVQIGVGGPTHPITIPPEAGPLKLWPLIDAGSPTPPIGDGFVRNGGGVFRNKAVTRAEYEAIQAVPDPGTVYLVFEN